MEELNKTGGENTVTPPAVQAKEAKPKREYSAADPAFVNGVHDKAVGEGMALIRNKIGLVPFTPLTHKRILIAGCGRNESEMSQLRKMAQALESRGFTVDFQEYLLTCWQDEMNALQGKYDLVIVCYNIPFTAVDCYDKCASTTWSAHLLDKSKSLFVNFTEAVWICKHSKS